MLVKNLYKVFASMEFTIVILLFFVTVLIIATTFDYDIAQQLFYSSLFFKILLALIALNLLSAILVRFSLGKKQMGFIITHMGILAILIGAFLTARFGTDISLELTEDNSIDKINSIPLKFSVFVKEINKNEQSTELIVYNKKGELKKIAKITPKIPFSYSGYTFFQSEYFKSNDDNTSTVVYVAKDPGIMLKYAGTAILITGMFIMFYLKK